MFEKERELGKYCLSLVGGDPEKIRESYKSCMDENLVWRLIGSTPISGSHMALAAVDPSRPFQIQRDSPLAYPEQE